MAMQTVTVLFNIGKVEMAPSDSTRTTSRTSKVEGNLGKSLGQPLFGNVHMKVCTTAAFNSPAVERVCVMFEST